MFRVLLLPSVLLGLAAAAEEVLSAVVTVAEEASALHAATAGGAMSH